MLGHNAMLHSRHDEQAFKLMLLQLRKRRSLFRSRLTGGLAQKRGIEADALAQKAREQLTKDVEACRWTYPPRARVAVSMRFSAGRHQAPALHNLVKFYLDLMCSIVFEDDRQVGCLVAECWRPRERYVDPRQTEGRVFVEVERLTDHKRRFDLFFALLELDGFRDHIKWHSRYRYLVDEDDWFDGFFDDLIGDFINVRLSDMVADQLEIPIEAREPVRTLDVMEHQRRLLMINRIDRCDRPGGPKGKHLRKERVELRDLQPMSINLGGLPARGESKDYKRRIRQTLQRSKKQFRSLSRILVPVALDVQVTPRTLRLGKDLDNIMKDIAPALAEELLDEEAYLHAYRIYDISKAPDDNMPSSIRLKLLPPRAISEFDDTMEEVLNIGKDWLEHQLRWM